MLQILTLEDELEINDFYKVLLEEFKFNVHTASTFEEALDIAKNEDIDVAIVDNKLTITGSSRDGLDAIPEIKRLCPNVKVIMVSASYPASLEDEFQTFGIDILVRKPFNIDEMLYNIKQLVGDKADIPDSEIG